MAGQHHIEPLLAKRQPIIGAFWHGRMLMAPFAWPTRDMPFTMLISKHRDGDLIAKAIAHFHVGAVRGSPGSSDKGAVSALKALAKELRAGRSVGITPDGPRGPGRRAHEGCIHLSRLTGAPIMPFAFSSRPGWRMASWDAFLVPPPFAKGSMVFGEPIAPPGAGDSEAMEATLRLLQDRLDHVTDEADRLVGLPVAARP